MRKSEASVVSRDYAVEVNGMSVLYGAVAVLQHVALTVPPGAFLGVVGDRGAGKTTLLRVLATLQSPTSGSANVFGRDVVAEAKMVRSQIGYMPRLFPRCDGLSTREYLELFSTLHGLAGQRRRHVVAVLLELLDLAELGDMPVDELPVNSLWRVNLARTLVNEPKLLLLDEPVRGLGISERIALYQTLEDLHDIGTTILISSDSLIEGEGTWTHVAMLERGQLVQCGPASSALWESAKRQVGSRDPCQSSPDGDSSLARHEP